jgi:hypothetical protein
MHACTEKYILPYVVISLGSVRKSLTETEKRNPIIEVLPPRATSVGETYT